MCVRKGPVWEAVATRVVTASEEVVDMGMGMAMGMGIVVVDMEAVGTIEAWNLVDMRAA